MGIGYTECVPQKTSKVVLAPHLHKVEALAECIPDKSAIVIDGMSLVQKVGQNDNTFEEIAAVIHSMVFKEGSHSPRIDKCVYLTFTGTCQLRMLSELCRTMTKAYNCRTYLRNSGRSCCGNPTIKPAWYSSYWTYGRSRKYTDTLVGKCLKVIHLDKCWKITQGCCEEIPTTSIQHEKAHGRLLIHAAHASREGIKAVVICADDTDVFIICLAFIDNTQASLFQLCGTQTCTRLIDISTCQHPLDQMCAKHYPDCMPLLAATPWAHLPGKTRPVHWRCWRQTLNSRKHLHSL